MGSDAAPTDTVAYVAYVAQSFYGQLKKEEKKTAQRRERDRGREGEGEQTSTPEGGSIVHRVLPAARRSTCGFFWFNLLL